ncbi:MAG: vesicular-fusion protein S17 [Chrysothrix sp. TS-e1954]|nr:MAG: vesicular-fusion protein S17 [Chrysothrix sp. TS-e1954]
MAQDPRSLLQQAQKAESAASGGFSLFGGKADKQEKAADLYVQTANAFRLQKSSLEAGQAFQKAASLQLALNEPDDAANTYQEAFKVLRKDDPETAATVLQKAINHYTSKGNFRRAATQQQNLAELYENEVGDQKRALEAYETAASWFESDNATALANKLFLKVGDIAGEVGEYGKSAAEFEKVARESINNNLMRWSVKEYLLKAGIVHLASGDMVAVKRALESYVELDNSFAQQREYLLLTNLVEAVDASDQEAFSDHLYQYDRMSKLDKWKTGLLLKVKESIEQQGEDFS